MPIQKTFKRTVRARMAKTGESYTAARHQLLRKSGPETPDPPPNTPESTTETMVSAEAMRRATGRTHDEWFAILDGWGASERTHTEIARWLRDGQGVDGWWSQQVTVEYERARGRRAPGQMADGFTVGANRTIGADADTLLAAFTDGTVRERWLPTAGIRQRPTRATLTARFDWPDPPSRLVVAIAAKGERKATVSIAHEKLPDAETAERLKTQWRAWLGALKDVFEGD